MQVKLTELVNHGLDTVALLDSLVRNPDDASSRGSASVPERPLLAGRQGRNSREDRRGQERVRHRLHVDQANRLELAQRRARDRGLSLGLDDLAPHGLEDLLREPRISLQRRRTNVGDRARRASDRRDGERVSRAAGVALDVVHVRVLVHALGDAVHVEQLASVVLDALYVDPEGPHHRDGHVNVRLGDDLTTGEFKRDRFRGVRRA